MHRFVQMPSQPGTACSICLMGPTIGIGTHLCQIVVQLGLYSCTCLLPSPGFVVFLAAQGLCNMLCCQHSQVQAPWYVSDRINTREQACIYSTLFCCSDCAVAAAQAILITAACTGFVQQVVEIRLQACKVIQTGTSNRVH
jgi:hypothetical protein